MKRSMIAAVSVICMGAMTAQAKDTSYTLTYDDAELATQQGVAAVHERIEMVAKSYCPDYSKVLNLSSVRSCVKEVTDDLVAKVGHPQLTQFHTGEAPVRIAASARDVNDRS